MAFSRKTRLRGFGANDVCTPPPLRRFAYQRPRSPLLAGEGPGVRSLLPSPAHGGGARGEVSAPLSRARGRGQGGGLCSPLPRTGEGPGVRSLLPSPAHGGGARGGGLFARFIRYATQAREAESRAVVVGGAVFDERVERGGQRGIVFMGGSGAVLRNPGQQFMSPLEAAAHLFERETAR